MEFDGLDWDDGNWPKCGTDDEAEHFLDTADLSEYDFSQFKPMKFEFRKKDARVNMRLTDPFCAPSNPSRRKSRCPISG